MGFMPKVRGKNTAAALPGDGIEDVSPVLPEVQEREYNQCKKFYHRNQNSQTLRRSADRKAGHALRLIF